MADKDKEVKEAINSTQTEDKKSKKDETPLKVYKVGDLNFKCHACGHNYIIEEGVQGGIRFDVYTTNKHKLAMACPQCKAVLEMYFTEGDSSGVVDAEGNPIKSNPENKTVKEDIATEDTVEEESYEVIDEDNEEPIQEEELPEDDMEETELPEEVKESIDNENKERENEVSVQEEDKQTESV